LPQRRHPLPRIRQLRKIWGTPPILRANHNNFAIIDPADFAVIGSFMDVIHQNHGVFGVFLGTKETHKPIIILVLIFLPISCREPTSEWRGHIEENNGTIFVNNPDEPLYQEPLFTLEEELSIGGDDDREEYIFIEIQRVAIDDHGNIYVLDRRGAHIKVFDNTGTYLRTIGRRGQGPGEFQNPIEMFLTPDQNIAVQDFINRRLSFYTLEGEHLQDQSFGDKLLGKIEMDPDGSYYAMTTEYYVPNENGIQLGQYLIKKFDGRLDYLDTLTSSSVPEQMDHFMYYFMLLFDIDKDGNVVVGNGRDYVLDIFDTDGNLIRRIKKEHSPVEVTPGAVREQKESMLFKLRTKIPTHHSAYRSFRWSEDDRIYVRTWEEPMDGSTYFYDVFDSEGRYIAKMPLSIEPWILKNDKLYSLSENENGYYSVKRYNVNWNR